MLKNLFGKKEEKPTDAIDIMPILTAVMEYAGKLMFAKDKPAALKGIISEFITPDRLQEWKTKLHKAITEYENKNNCSVDIRICQAAQQSDITLVVTHWYNDQPSAEPKYYYLSQLTHEQIMYFINLIFDKNGTTNNTGAGERTAGN